MTREEELAKEGWVKQNTIDEPRLSELVELYESLGFEVHLEEVRPQEVRPQPATKDEKECIKCLEAKLDRYKTIYTRPKQEKEVK